eukprot:GHVU01139495.1.p1 GENE.GHVU01139495.1~~GHVU01139495.1.p1  ORF type:complete len:481 (+),score=78.21 GHVU01139495.1:167-1609(+)
MEDAGRPISPTVHPRTRPEAEDYAMKNRSTGDWFRHDGKNIESAAPPPVRLPSRQGKEISVKMKTSPEAEWFQHKAEAPGTETPPKNPSPVKARPQDQQVVQQISDKVQGKEEGWAKYEENQNYYSPRPKDRITAAGADEYKSTNEKASVDWYNHDSTTSDQPQAKHRVNTPQAEENYQKARGNKDWFGHDSTVDGSLVPQPGSRVHTSDAQGYLDRNRAGATADWYTHEHKNGSPTKSPPFSPRGGSSAEKNNKTWHNSENWFNHDDNKGYHDPAPAGKGNSSDEMRAKSRGDQMNSVMHQEGNKGYYAAKPNAKVKPEAQSNAQKADGSMKNYLDQKGNEGYESTRPNPKVKAEAKETFEKNKGSMGEFMIGHGAPPDRKEPKQRVKTEAQQYAERNKGTTGTLFSNYGQESQSPQYASRVKPEASQYAERNRGTLGPIMSQFASASVSDRPVPKVRGDLARDMRERNQGTVGLLQMD